MIDLLPKVRCEKNILGIYELLLYVNLNKNTTNITEITYNVYLEIYGIDRCHLPTAVAWIGGLTNVSLFKNETVLMVELHPHWLKTGKCLFEFNDFEVPCYRC